MELSISGRNVEVTDAMREHAAKRVQRLERFSSHLMGADVTLSIEGERHQTEIVVTVKRKGDLVAKSETHDMYLSIDQAIAKMEAQLQKFEKRARDRRESGHDKWAEPPPASTAEETPDENIEEQ